MSCCKTQSGITSRLCHTPTSDCLASNSFLLRYAALFHPPKLEITDQYFLYLTFLIAGFSFDAACPPPMKSWLYEVQQGDKKQNWQASSSSWFGFFYLHVCYMYTYRSRRKHILCMHTVIKLCLFSIILSTCRPTYWFFIMPIC